MDARRPRVSELTPTIRKPVAALPVDELADLKEVLLAVVHAALVENRREGLGAARNVASWHLAEPLCSTLTEYSGHTSHLVRDDPELELRNEAHF